MSSLDRIGRQICTSRFMRWWVGELQSLIPAWLQPGKPSLDGVPRQSIEDPEAGFSDAGDRNSPGLVLLVPSTKTLRRTIRLPLATEENLSQVLTFQMEQYTPFPAADLYFSHQVLSRDAVRGQLEVELVAVQRKLIDGVIKRAQEAGRVPLALQILNANGDALPYNLLPEQDSSKTNAWRANPVAWLAALVVVMVFAALALPIFVKREAAIQMIPLVERAKKAAETVDGVRRDLDSKITRHNFVLEKRATFPTTIEALEELTRVLPDDTWVQTLDWKGKEILIQGETASSVKLVGLFEQSKMFKDASFRSPLTKGQTPGTERFSLALQLRPLLPAEASSSMPAVPASKAASESAP